MTYEGPYDSRICVHDPKHSHDQECDLRAVAFALRDERDSLATQLEQMRRDLAEREAEAKRDGEIIEELKRVRDGQRERGRERAADIDRLTSERDEARSDRDAMAQTLGEANVALAEARATNAKLHRRAQGAEAGKPEDEETIRRLRAEVRATAKHAGYVAGHVYRIIDARNAEMRRAYEAIRERDEARAKLVRIGETIAQRYMMGETAHDTIGRVLHIIDAKEGGQ